MAIPVYISIYDLKPTETLWDEIADVRDKSNVEHWTKEQLKEDIKKNGLKYSLTVDYEGNIINGNARYWICRELFEEGDTRFEYLQADLMYLSGRYVIKYEEKPDEKLIKDVFQWICNTKYTIIPSTTEFPEYELADDPKFFKRFKEVNAHQTWEVYRFPSKDKKYFVLYQIRRN